MAINQDATITLKMVANDLMSGKIGSAIGKIDALTKRGGIMGSVFQGVGIQMGMMLNPVDLVGRAISTVTEFLGDATKAAIADEQSQARLRTSLEANVEGWDGNTDAIEANIEAGQRLGFADEDLRDSLTILVGATGDVTEAEKTMAIAMDLARFKGIDLRTASEALIKVEGGHYRSLAQLGIKLREGATSTEALAAVQKVAAGQAQDFGETTAGTLLSMNIAIGEVVEDIGKDLLPMFMKLAVFIRDEVLPALDALGEGVGQVGDAFGEFQTASNDFADDIHNNIVDPIQRFLDPLFNNPWELKPPVDNLSGPIHTVFEDVEAASREMDVGVDRSTDRIGRHLKDMAERAKRVTRVIVSNFEGMGDSMADVIANDVGKVKDAMAQIRFAIENPMAQAEHKAWLIAKSTSKLVRQGLRSEQPEIREDTRAFVNGINAILRGLDARIDMTASYNYRGPNHPTRAGGGPMAAGIAHLVGEEGRELVVANTDSYVIPHGQTEAMLSGSRGNGGMNFVYAPTYSAASPAEARSFAERLVPEIMRAMRGQRLVTG